MPARVATTVQPVPASLGLAALALVLLVVIAFWPATEASFIWDDDANLTDNSALRSLHGLFAIWTTPGTTTQYYPMVYTSYAVEYAIWGLEPAGYHADNILLHAANALLLWRLLVLMGAPAAWLGAALFAVHPVQVETVAWVTERKNLLSFFFYLLSAHAYLRFTGDFGVRGAPSRSALGYALCLASFIAALISKVTAVTLGPALLVVVWWRKGRLERGDVLPVLPLLVLAVPIGVLTRSLESGLGVTLGFDWHPTALERVIQGSRALCFYLSKLAWPRDLTFVYPRWEIDASDPVAYAPALLILAVAVGLWLARDRVGRGPLAALLFFAGSLAPVLGMLEVYYFRFSFVADHWQYVACIGPMVLVAAALRRGAARSHARAQLAVRAGAAALLLVLTLQTWQHSRTFESSESLWRDSLSKNPSSFLARYNLGVELQRRARYSEAIAEYRLAREIDPRAAPVYVNMGLIEAGRGRLDLAVPLYRQAIVLDPQLPRPHWNLGLALERQGQLDAALPHLYRALELVTTQPQERARLTRSNSDLADLLVRHGRTPTAIAHYRRALELDPDYAPAREGLDRAMQRDRAR